MSKPISDIIIELGKACQLNCPYCFLKYREMKSKYQDSDNFEQIMNRSWNKITLTGGEPTLYDLDDVIKNLKDYKKLEILTNGINHINLEDKPNITITVSLDGNKDVMLNQRGVTYTNYNKIIENIADYMAENKVNITTVVTKESINYLYEFLTIDRPFNKNEAVFLTPVCDYKNKEFLDQDHMTELLKIQVKALEYYEYHAKISTPLITKEMFTSIYNKDYILYFNPFYIREINMFYYVGLYFRSLEELELNYEMISKEMTLWILEDYLKNVDDSFLFDPYSVVEIYLEKIKINLYNKIKRIFS